MTYKKVGILTTFDGVQEAYSLNIVTQMQLKMLVMNGYEPVFIATKGFKAPADTMYNHEGVTIRNYNPVKKHYTTKEYVEEKTFYDEVNGMVKDFREIMKDLDVVITHDIIYQPDALKHNMAMRIYAKENPKIMWLNWVHSATPPVVLAELLKREDTPYLDVLKQPLPDRSFIVYPNAYDIPRVARAFNVNTPQVQCVNHPDDMTKYFDPLLQKLIFDKNILSADYICTYPLRLDQGKQPEYNFKILHALKQRGNSVRLIIGDFHSTGGDKVTYRVELKKLMNELSLTDDEVTFLSEVPIKIDGKTRYPWGVEAPQKHIFDLQSISNLFILPSKSETYSLVAQEAMRNGCIMVMNHDFPPLTSVYKDFPIYTKFSANVDAYNDRAEMGDRSINVQFHNEWDYWDLCARRIMQWMETDRSLKERKYIRQTKNLNTIFKTQMEPLINFEKW